MKHSGMAIQENILGLLRNKCIKRNIDNLREDLLIRGFNS